MRDDVMYSVILTLYPDENMCSYYFAVILLLFSTAAWRHYRNRPQRKHLLLLSHVGCPATVVNKHLYY
jgi:hypothetical protein